MKLSHLSKNDMGRLSRELSDDCGGDNFKLTESSFERSQALRGVIIPRTIEYCQTDNSKEVAQFIRSETFESNDDNNVFFANIHNTPELTKKSDMVQYQYGTSCKRPLKRIYYRLQDSTKDSKEKILEKEQLETWYWKACQEDRVAFMRLCVMLKFYIYEEYV
ncbi:hypothetical protein FQR65_LT08254 [Abscondita terminalis]|nr:hypothetical protein FQR65_LT08254 [Abscondita terminalis]